MAVTGSDSDANVNANPNANPNASGNAPSSAASHGIRVFMVFAFAYMLSYAYRTVNAVIATPLKDALNVGPADLGLLSSAYFFSFALMQLPLGVLLDKVGARRIEAALMVVAGLGAFVFAAAPGFAGLWIGRALIGIGVSACLMASYKGFASWCPPSWQAQLSSWMLMAGSVGALLATVPAQALLPEIGWRGLFVAMGVLSLLAALLLWVGLPKHERVEPNTSVRQSLAGFAEVMANRQFRALVPVGVLVQGGFMAMQSLWSGPWLIRVAGLSERAAAQALFVLTALVAVAYLLMGVAMARLNRPDPGSGVSEADQAARRTASLRRFLVMGLAAHMLASLALAVTPAGGWPLTMGLMYGTICSANLAYVLVNASFRVELIGRASTLYNLMIFVGAFALQWGFGGVIELAQHAGVAEATSFRVALGVLAVAEIAALLRLMWLFRRGV